MGAPARSRPPGIVRAYVQHGMQTWPQPVKLTQTGPMFRYDRPQAGPLPPVLAVRRRGDRRPGSGDRRRDHRARRPVLPRGGPDGRRGAAQLDRRPACRPAYIEALTAYYRERADDLPPHRARAPRAQPAAPARLEGPGDGRAQRRGAADHRRTCARPCAAHFDGRPGAPRRRSACRYRLEPGLVRGLDYYTRTAFEFYVAGREGQQQALGGGGRYDGLVELLGGRPTPGIGFGLGLDRVLLALAASGGRGRPRRRVRRSRSSSAPTRRTPSARLRIATELRAAGIAARAELARRKLGRAARGGRPATARISR